MRHHVKMVLVALVVLLLVSACAAPPPPQAGAPASGEEQSAATTEGPQPGGTLIIGKSTEAVGLDPHLVTARSSFEVIAQVYNQLVDLDEDYLPIPELAESWENPDDLTFIFHLRPDVKFHNGRTLVAEDVKFSFERIQDPAVASPWSSQLELIERIETPDERTVIFHLSQPFGAFLSTIASTWAAIVPPEEVEANGDLQRVMVGTGPFMLEEYVEETRTVLRANPDYFEGAPLLDGITYLIIPDEAARLAALRTGEIHMSALSNAASAGLAARSEGVSVASQQTTDYYLLGLNTQRAPFDDVRVRQALSLAIDRQAIVDSVFFGEGLVTGPIVPTLGKWSVPPEELPFYQPDVEQAKALLAEAGYPDGFETTITASPRFPEFTSIALVIQNQLKQIGVTATLDQVEWGTFIQKWRDRDFDTFVSYNGSGNDPDRALYPMLHTGGSVNAFQFSDPEIDRMLEEARTTVDQEERIRLYHELAQAIARQAPLIFLNTRTEYVALRDNVRDFHLSPVDTYRSLKQVWLAP
ncbi:ABC transporter substrate-binding protein [Litorilinea aerophila]|nr:ABC transporter substrate-binding protein [Litorilinea aerophila]MCC9078281.1 ABC transporter substrate-binding protein [Litorilinea aerophila]GIV77503.1 MAG: ABC transporter substrate-binding protein [Litorilinea sp.]